MSLAKLEKNKAVSREKGGLYDVMLELPKTPKAGLDVLVAENATSGVV